MNAHLLILFGGLLSCVAAEDYDLTLCRKTVKGQEYVGGISQTAGGLTCQAWSVESPHSHGTADHEFPGGSKVAASNFCRNPDNSADGPWCYTTDPAVRWQTCDVPLCFGIVDEVKPRYIGGGGGVKVTIFGEGFAKNQFNFGDDAHVGNRVYFVNELQEKECEIHKDGSNEVQLQCYSPPLEGFFAWHIRVVVDGVPTPDEHLCNGQKNGWRCTVYDHAGYRPRIDWMFPQSGTPDTIVTVLGVLHTARYGSDSGTNTNGVDSQILRAYMGGQNCEMKNGDEFYGLALEREHSRWARLSCKIKSTFVTNANFSVLIDSPYGRTVPDDDVYRISARNKILMFQSYAVVNSINPSSGSTVGGQKITISGKFFDETTLPAEVQVGGEPCVVESVSDDEIICTTPAEMEAASYPGNRGWRHEMFNSDYKDIDSLTDVSDRDDDLADSTFWNDESSWCESGWADHNCMVDYNVNNFNMRSKGFFIPQMSGDYRFYLKGDDQALLYFSATGPEADKAIIANFSTPTSSFTAQSSQMSEKFSLTAGTAYYIEAVAAEVTSWGEVSIAAAYYDTSLNQVKQGRVHTEVQTVKISGDNLDERYTVSLNDLTAQTAVKEVQTVTVTWGNNTAALWRLALYGALTDFFDVDTSDRHVQEALNDLPSLAPERASVISAEIENGRVFTVTFVSDMGDWPLLTGTEEGCTVTITEDTKGVASLSRWRFALDDNNRYLPSGIMDADTDAVQMESSLSEMFKAHCPDSMSTSGTGVKFIENYESSSTSGRLSGIVDFDAEPFCGKGSLHNPDIIYNAGNTGFPDVDINFFEWLCFAYRGEFENKIHLTASAANRNIWGIDLPYEFISDGEWHYTCIDMGAFFAEVWSDHSDFVLDQIWLTKKLGGDIFIDTLYIGGTPTTLNPESMNDRRIPQTVAASSVSVAEQAESPGVFEVVIKPRHCENGLKMLEVYNGPTTDGSTAANSNSVTFGGGNWPDVSSIGVIRTQSSSPPVTGTFNLEYKGKSENLISAKITASALETKLQVLLGLDEAKVERSGTCYGYSYDIIWTQSSGDQAPVLANGDDLTGDNVAIEVIENDGHSMFDPILGDQLRTRELTPQVSVIINGISSKCNGTCEYAWDSGLTPTISTIDPESGDIGEELTISGEGFGEDANSNTVIIGGGECDITSASATEIVCTAGAGEIGEQPVKVYVHGKGMADGSVAFTYDLSVSDVSPLTGGSGGGTIITVTGSGFRSNIAVTVDGADCELISVMYGQIVCQTPAGTEGDVTVTVDVDGTTADGPAAFAYDDSLAPTIESFTPTTSLAKGGEELVIIGSGFVDTAGVTVSFQSSDGDLVAIEVTSGNDTFINAIVPALNHGTYDLVVFVQGVGYAMYSGGDEMTVTFRVDFISPNIGSMEGGTLVTVGGEGFGSSSDDINVMFGESNCEVEEISDTELMCRTERGSLTVEVSNDGINPRYGLGYAWSPYSVAIQAGDAIRWRWGSARFVDTVFKVQQTASLEEDYDGTGFSSGDEATSDGSFTYQFNEVGTYFYSSGFVDTSGNVVMRGLISVSAKASTAYNLTVSMGGVEATLVDDSGVDAPNDTSECPGTIDAINGCSEDSASTGYAYEMSFDVCSTPEVTTQDVNIGYIDTNITISGDGFSNEDCQNEVMFGDYACTPLASSATEIICAMNPAESPDVGISFTVSVRVHNRGDALVLHENNTYTLKPSIASVTPTTGSLNGGTVVTITGAGFVGDADSVTASVGAGGVSCEIDSVSYTEIICTTQASSATTEEIIVLVTNQLDAVVQTECAGTCDFEYTADATPVLTSATPAQAGGASTEIVIVGSGFGTEADDVTVMISEFSCNISAIADDNITCTVGHITAKGHSMTVSVSGKGSTESIAFSHAPEQDSITPSSGSTMGGQSVTISGSGYMDDMTVSIGGVACDIQSIAIDEIICVTGAREAATVDVDVTRSSITFPAVAFDYAAESTPTVTEIDPASGIEDNELTITGTGFSETPAENTVTIGDAECTVTASSETEITCTASGNVAASYPVNIHVAGSGNADSSVEFTYVLTAGSADPDTGSFGGHQLIEVSGAGFFTGATVEICGEQCDVQSIAPTAITCYTPAMDSRFGNGDVTCNITVIAGGEVSNNENAYTYATSTTPEVSSISPTRGGTAGGTRITIAGTKFGADGTNVVKVADTECTIIEETTVEIICETNAPAGGSSKTNVVVDVGDNGVSLKANTDYWYVDVWSSRFTWGDNDPPGEGEFVVIPPGQLLLLDESTAKLKMLLIQGGELLFDEVDLTLEAENILITNGGKLTVGTEEEPFQHEATIMMHGFLRSPELPIYGAKCLAVREGELNLHGKPLRMTWTRLGATASVGDTDITLETGQADWPVGSLIVISTTGHKHSQIETEQRYITAVSNDGLTLSLDEPLEYAHLGKTQDLGGGHSLEMRAEVGILSRNVRFLGSRDVQWAEEIEACPEGFDTGEFSTQTCFQGRFGDEIGSDQFGGQIMFHAPVKDQKLAKGRISYIEVNYAGQAFRLGRYPIHFHLNGDMSGSYVRGVAIHETFNRAINIHGTHNVKIEQNVIYNVMGGALFLEDGIETGNEYMYNLVLFVKASSSLLNDDITPAAFWATNPNNTYIGNAAAGGTHFGWWYSMKEHPVGPSYTTDICPDKVPLGIFSNNTVHSQGWFGIWTFEFWHPTVNGACSGGIPEPAKFRGLVAWNNEKGLEWVIAGALQFHDSILANNELAGAEGKMNTDIEGTGIHYTNDGPMINNTVIVAQIPGHEPQNATRAGVVLPYSGGLIVKDVTFINYDKSYRHAIGFTKIQGTCTFLCGGFNYHFSGIQFVGGDEHKGAFSWTHEGVFVDLDGTLTGVTNGKIIPTVDTLNPDKCSHSEAFSQFVPASLCDASTNFGRMAWNHVSPSSLNYKTVIMMNDFGSHSVLWTDKRITHGDGWMTVVEMGESYKTVWENIEHITNISYSAGYYDLSEGGVIIKHNISQKPDRYQVIPGVTKDIADSAAQFLSHDDNVHGDVYYDANEKELSYLISDRKADRKKRAIGGGSDDEPVNLQAYRCFWPNCEPPPDPNSLPPIAERPPSAVYWSDPTIWPNQQVPADGEEVVIEAGKWVVLDVPEVRLKSLVLHGNLELDYEKNPITNEYHNFELEAEHIIIMEGRLVVGWEDNRFMGEARILLTGDQYSEAWPQESGAVIGQKAIASYGGLDLHGRQRSPLMTTLAATIAVGTSTITVNNDVYWESGEEIMITTTGFDAWETETFTIESVSDDKRTITLTGAIQHKHLGETLTSGENSYSLAAEVALLTRNIKVEGAYHLDMTRLGFGGHILISQTTSAENTALKGWARISYTQFINMGQLGFNEPYDPRFAISYVQTGEVSSVKPSYLKGNSFDTSFSPGIGIFGADKIRVQDNVMYKTVAGGMVVYGEGHVVERNLIALNQWTGSYEGRRELKNFFYSAAFELANAGTITFTDNIAAGSERAGFRTHGEPCGEEGPVQNNRVHSSMFGVMLWDKDPKYPCTRIESFTAWKNFHWGIYLHVTTSIELANNIMIENGVATYLFSYSPPSLSHVRSDKTISVVGGYVSGATEWFECGDVEPDNANYELGGRLPASYRSPSGGLVGLSTASFDSGPNNSPSHPFNGRMSYPAINGKLDISDVTFANFAPRDCSSSTINDVLFSTLPAGDDFQHPTYMSGVTLEESVNSDNKVHFHRSNVGRVNPSDCVDMDCDGQKKNIVIDVDGTFLGTPGGVVVDDAADNWDGDARYGLGDYRIPSVMLVDPDGVKSNPEDIYTTPGIIRDADQCTWHALWQAWECYGNQYTTLIIESMDADSEVRRLSPIAIRSDTGYLDLLNGPMDHGWCSGYTCKLRISTFFATVAYDHHYDIYMTSVNPQNTKFYLLNAVADQSVSIAVYYSSPQRLDIFLDGTYIYPTNAVVDDEGGFSLTSPTTDDEFKPSLSDAAGQNYFDRLWQLQYMILKGEGELTVIVKEVVLVSLSLPPMSIDEFFGENLVNNLAAFLEVPANKIRIVNVVRETNRRKRQAGGTTIDFEIGDAPTADGNVADVNSGDLNRDSLLNLTRKVVDAVQLGTLGDSLNVTITGINVQEPLPPPENSTESDWATLSSEDSLAETIQIPSEMSYEIEIVAEREMQAFPVQPAFAMYDGLGNLVNILGSRADPWKLQATLVKGEGAHENAYLVGETVCGFKDGWCNFTTLGISHVGSGYRIDFAVFDPVSAGFTAASESLSVSGAVLTAGWYDHEYDTMENTSFTAIADIRDATSDLRVEQIDWKGHAWTATVSLYNSEMNPEGAELTGNLTQSFNLETGLATFDDLAINIRGRYSLQVVVTSDPTDFTLTRRSEIIEVASDGVEMQDAEVEYEVTIRSHADFDSVAAGNEDIIEAATYNYLLSLDDTISYHDFSVTRGSIYIIFYMTGEADHTSTVIDSITSAVSSGFSLALPSGNTGMDTYMLLDDSVHAGLSGSSAETTTAVIDSGNAGQMSIHLIIGIASVALLAAIITVIIIIVIRSKQKRGKVSPDGSLINVSPAPVSAPAHQTFNEEGTPQGNNPA